MKKIVHITTVHPAQDTRIFQKECNALANSGHKVFLLAVSDENKTVDNVDIIALAKPKNRFHRMTWYLWKVYKTALHLQADLYHFHDPELIIVGLLLRLHRKKVVYDVHEDVPRDILIKPWLPKKLRRICGKFFEYVENFSARYFNAIVTVTPLLTARFQCNNRQVVEIRNYPRISMAESQSVKKNGLCYTGLISRERGIFEMLQVAHRCNLPLNLAGKFNCDHLKSEIRSHPSWSRTNYFGFLDRIGVEKIYAESQIGLALLHPGPTYQEALPIKLFEYMAAGLPVVVSNFPLWHEIVAKHDCGICVDPQNIEAVYNAISFLQNNSELSCQMGKRGQQAIKNFYNWDLEEKKLLALYANIFGEDEKCVV